LRIFGQTIADMYIWAIALLSIVVAISSYTIRIIPYSLLLAVAVAALTEFAIAKFYLKRRDSIPVSGIITGIIIGSVAPFKGTLLIVVIAALIAIASKFVIKVKHVNIFNPATLGLLVALAVFGVGDQWWAASNYNIYGIAVSLTLILVIASYEARRWIASLSFVAVVLAFSLVSSGLSHFSVIVLAAAFFSINFFFAFIMLAEPKTSPPGKYGQMAFGVFVALAYASLAVYRIEYPLLIALLLGNIAYTLYKLLRK
jgi:Na+-translocating ferredoxin:NAD+ oxidoreductase RnfD subunit